MLDHLEHKMYFKTWRNPVRDVFYRAIEQVTCWTSEKTQDMKADLAGQNDFLTV